MTTDNTSAHLDGACDKCFGWVGESDPESGEMGQCTACFGMARRAQPSELVAEVLRLRAANDGLRVAARGVIDTFLAMRDDLDAEVDDAARVANAERTRDAFRALVAEVSK